MPTKTVNKENTKKTRPRRSSAEVSRLIISAAREVFSERGYDGATTREIAQRAKTTTVQLFRHFGSKENLFQQSVFEPFENYVRDYSQKVASSHSLTRGYSDVRDYIDGMCRLFNENRELMTALMAGHIFIKENSPAANSSALQNFLNDTESALKHLDINLGVDTDLGARLSVATILVMTLFDGVLFTEDKSKKEQDRRLDNLTRFVIGGLSGVGSKNIEDNKS